MMQLEGHHSGERLDFQAYHPESLRYPEHLHRCFEFLYCRQGETTLSINQKKFTLQAEEFALIFPYQTHEIMTIEYSQLDVLVFSPEFIEDFYAKLGGVKFENPIFSLKKKRYQRLFPSLFETSSLYERKAALYELLSIAEKSTIFVPSNDNKQIVTQIILYIEGHFKENLTMKQLSEHLGYSDVHVSKIISTNFDNSFPNILNHARVNYACYLLSNTHQTVTTIADSSGFQNVRSFNRNFKKIMGRTPKEFRDQAKQEECCCAQQEQPHEPNKTKEK